MPGECRGIPGEGMEVCPKCQGNAVECQGNEREWVQSARGMQENAGECQGKGRGFNMPGECRGMPGKRMEVDPKCQGNARGMYRYAWKVPGECMGMHGTECKMSEECRGMKGDSR